MMVMDIESEIVLDLVNKYEELNNNIQNMADGCKNPPSAPEILNVGNEMNSLMNVVGDAESNLNKDFKDIGNLLLETIEELKNNDDVNFIDDKSINEIIDFSNLENAKRTAGGNWYDFLFASASAEGNMVFNGRLSLINEALFTVLNRSCYSGVYSVIDSSSGIRYEYNLNTHKFNYTGGKEYEYLWYVPIGLEKYTGESLDDEEKINLAHAIGHMDTIIAMTGQREISIEYDSNKKCDYSLGNISSNIQTREAMIVTPMKDSNGSYKEMYDSIVAFTRMLELFKGADEGYCSGNNILYGFSIGGHAAADITFLHPRMFKGYVVDSHPTVDASYDADITFIQTSDFQEHINYWKNYFPNGKENSKYIEYSNNQHTRNIEHEVWQEFLKQNIK